jgi:hypothetical protein
MKLQQSQVWKQGEEYIRIVRLDRLAVDYKVMRQPDSKKGMHRHATKKEFCRLLKNAILLVYADTPPKPAE